MNAAWLDGAAREWAQWMARMTWQVTLLAAVVAAIAIVARKASPRFRHALWALVLVKLMIPPTLTLFTGLGHWLPLEPAFHLQTDAQTEAVVADVTPPPEIVEPEPIAPPIGAPLGADGAGVESFPDESASVVAPPADEPAAESVAAPVAPAAPTRPLHWWTVSFLVWLAGVVAVSILVAAQYVRLRFRLRGSVPVTDEAVLAVFDEARRTLRTGRRLRLFASPRITSPILFGVFRPGIYSPASILTTTSAVQLKPILLHELAHHRRRDLWVNWLQVLLQTLYWFHPLVWLANLRLRRERELIVDDLVLVHLKGGQEMYGQSLLDVLRKAGRTRLLAPGYVGIVETKSALARRLRRILDTDRRLRIRLGWFSVVALIALAVVLIPQAGAGVRAAGETVERKRTPGVNTEESDKARTNPPPAPHGLSRRRKPQWTYHLKNGAILEILGASELTNAGLRWWGPDGRLTSVPEYVNEADLDGRGRQLAFRLRGGSIERVQVYGRSPNITPWGHRDSGTQLIPVGDRRFVHIRFRIRGDQWTTVGTIPVTRADERREIKGTEDGPFHRVSDFVARDDCIEVTGTVTLQADHAHRAIAIGKAGREYVGTSWPSGLARVRHDFSSEFGLSLENLSAIALQRTTLSVEEVEVRNLRLVPRQAAAPSQGDGPHQGEAAGGLGSKTHLFLLRHAMAGHVAKVVGERLTDRMRKDRREERGLDVQVDSRLNALGVAGTPEDVAKVASIVKELDVARAEIRISARVMQVKAGKAKLVSMPKMVCLDGTPAIITIGQRVPVAPGGGGKPPEYETVGMVLRVTARVVGADKILLKAAIGMSRLTSDPPPLGPIIRGTGAEVVATVADGRSVEMPLNGPDGEAFKVLIEARIVRNTGPTTRPAVVQPAEA